MRRAARCATPAAVKALTVPARSTMRVIRADRFPFERAASCRLQPGEPCLGRARAAPRLTLPRPRSRSCRAPSGQPPRRRRARECRRSCRPRNRASAHARKAGIALETRLAHDRPRRDSRNPGFSRLASLTSCTLYNTFSTSPNSRPRKRGACPNIRKRSVDGRPAPARTRPPEHAPGNRTVTDLPHHCASCADRPGRRRATGRCTGKIPCQIPRPPG